MTKDEAIDIYLKRQPSSSRAHVGNLIDTLVDLGILKLDKPKTATEKAVAAINVHINLFGAIKDGHTLINILSGVDVRIVEK